MVSTQERRRYHRIKDGVKVIYKKTGQLGENKIHVLDVGGGGVRLPLQDKMESGTYLELGLILPEQRDSFYVFARVVWQSKEPRKVQDGKEYYETGIEFLKMSLKERLQVIHYVHTETTKRSKLNSP
jgi:c-di-GMP-binding flagellar brake protein YcgR